MFRACVPALKGPPVPAAQRFQQYYDRHRDLILQSKREISPLLIKQRRIREQQLRYTAAISKLLAPYCYQKSTNSAAPGPSEIKASIALLTQAHHTANESGKRIRRLLHNARNGQQEFRTKYHDLYKRAKEDSKLEAELIALLTNRKTAAVPIKSLIEEGKRRTH